MSKVAVNVRKSEILAKLADQKILITRETLIINDFHGGK